MSNERKTLMPHEPVELPQALLDTLEGLPDPKNTKKMRWTPEQDKALLEYWERKNKADVSRVIGRNETTCRARFKYLRKQIDNGAEVKDYTE